MSQESRNKKFLTTKILTTNASQTVHGDLSVDLNLAQKDQLLISKTDHTQEIMSQSHCLLFPKSIDHRTGNQESKLVKVASYIFTCALTCGKTQRPMTCTEIQCLLPCVGTRCSFTCAAMQHPLTCTGMQHPLTCAGMQHPLTCTGIQHPLSCAGMQPQ